MKIVESELSPANAGTVPIARPISSGRMNLLMGRFPFHVEDRCPAAGRGDRPARSNRSHRSVRDDWERSRPGKSTSLPARGAGSRLLFGGEIPGGSSSETWEWD